MTSKSISIWLMLLVAQQTSAAEPQWLTDARAREGKLEEVRQIHSSDGWFSAQLPVAVIGRIDKVQGSYTVEFSVGSETTASCEIYPETKDPAALIRAVAQQVFPGVIEKAQGKVERRAIEVVNAGQFGTTPYLALNWLYRVNDGKEARVGAFKQYAAAKEKHGIYCQHIDIGYVHTFESVVRALVESVEFHDRTPVQKPFYSELSVASLKGLRVGYSMLTLVRDADGDVKAENRSAMLLPVTQDTVQSFDSSHVEWTHPDGSMINAAHASSVNDVLDMDLGLKPKKGVWHVEGEFKSKKIDQNIESQTSPSTWLSESLQRRAWLGGDSAAAADNVSLEWVSLDPIHFTESRDVLLEHPSQTGEAHLRNTTAGIVSDITADATTGQLLKAVIPIANQTITLERIDTQGSFWK
jgi:hypothetical protein